MKYYRQLAAGFCVALLILSCRSSQDQVKKEEAPSQTQKPADVGPGVPPGHCRIVGTVISISNALSAKAEDPCSKAPCMASIKVDEILGYGSAFTSPLSNGKEIQVQFTFTLAPSKEMSPPLPGLAVGSRFQADLSMGDMAIDKASKNPPFSIGLYTIR